MIPMWNSCGGGGGGMNSGHHCMSGTHYIGSCKMTW